MTTLTAETPAHKTVVETLTPTLTARLGFDAATAAQVTFYVYEEATHQEVASGVATASPGQLAQWTVPAAVLTPEKRYYWQATADTATSTLRRVFVPVGHLPTSTLMDPAPGAMLSGPTNLLGIPTGFLSVTKVEFLVDGQVVGAATIAPYSITWDPPTSSGSHQIVARTTGMINTGVLVKSSAPSQVTFGTGEAYLNVEDGPAPSPETDPAPELGSGFDTAEGTPPSQESGAQMMAAEGLPESCRSQTVTKKRVACYAVNYALERNPGYDSFGGTDCTNFVSQALRFGGFPLVGKPEHPPHGGVSDDNYKHWWYAHTPPCYDRTCREAASVSWVRTVSMWRQLIWHSKDLKESGNDHGPVRGDMLEHWWDMEPGDIVFIKWQRNDGTGPQPNHAMIVNRVTYGSDGKKNNIYFSQHSNDRLSVPYYDRYRELIAAQEGVPLSSVNPGFSRWWVFRPYNRYSEPS